MPPVPQSVGYGEMRQGKPGQRGKFVQVEARMSQTGANADEWVPVNPGTEGVLALGMAHVILKFETAQPRTNRDCRDCGIHSRRSCKAHRSKSRTHRTARAGVRGDILRQLRSSAERLWRIPTECSARLRSMRSMHSSEAWATRRYIVHAAAEESSHQPGRPFEKFCGTISRVRNLP